MNFYSDETYGERVAGVYDEWHPEYDPLAIDMLAELAQGGKGKGRALELGIGTGRIALPLGPCVTYLHRIQTYVSICDNHFLTNHSLRHSVVPPNVQLNALFCYLGNRVHLVVVESELDLMARLADCSCASAGAMGTVSRLRPKVRSTFPFIT